MKKMKMTVTVDCHSCDGAGYHEYEDYGIQQDICYACAGSCIEEVPILDFLKERLSIAFSTFKGRVYRLIDKIRAPYGWSVSWDEMGDRVVTRRSSPRKEAKREARRRIERAEYERELLASRYPHTDSAEDWDPFADDDSSA